MQKFPIKFKCGKTEYGGEFAVTEQSNKTDNGVTVSVWHCSHEPSKTQWIITRAEFAEYRAEYWSAQITATEKTEILGDIRWHFEFDGDGEVIGNYGDRDGEFACYKQDLRAGKVTQAALDGRPTHEYFPYWRLVTDKLKTYVVLDWQGTWQASFECAGGKCAFEGMQYGVSAYLNKGESFIMPKVLLLPYGDDCVNTWRHFYFKHIAPDVCGGLRPRLAVFNGSCEGLNGRNVNAMRELFDRSGVNYDFWWFDAGWGSDGTGSGNRFGQWVHGCNFDMNYNDFPDGLREFGKALKRAGKDFLLWFEPEVVRTPQSLREEFFAAHPDFKREWVLGIYDYDWCNIHLTALMLNLGNEQCRDWLLGRVFKVMDESGANIYRQDLNIQPAPVWRAADGEGRRGITENAYCDGLIKYYKSIRARYGDILMDSCASGGGRCDLGTMRFAVPLHYSDHQDVAPTDYNGHIYMQQVIWRWFPYVKNWLSPAAALSEYGSRSVYNACLVSSVSVADAENADFGLIRKRVDEWRELANYYLCDYYELAEPTRDDVQIKAFEFFDTQKGEGFAAVFNPLNGKQTEFTLRLKGLCSGARYSVTDKDSGREYVGSGEELSKLTVKVCPDTSYIYKIKEIK